MDDLLISFKRVFPHDQKTRSYATKCIKLFAHFIKTVSPEKRQTLTLYFRDKIRAKYKKLNTIITIFTQLRAVCEDPQCRETLRLTESERALTKRKGQARIETNNNHVSSFTEEQVRRAVQMLEQSEDPMDKIPLLMFQSGMRLIEVLKVSSIAPSSQGHKNYIRVKHLAKCTDTNKVVEKPLLFTTYKAFERQLLATRAFVKQSLGADRDNKQVTNHFNHAVNSRVRKALGNSYTSHMARKIYGTLSYKMFAEKHTDMSLNAWLEKVLGHKSINTSLSYSNVKVH